MRTLLLLVLLSHLAFSVKHSLKFIFIGSSGIPDFPEFSAAAMVDETVVAYCDPMVNTKEDWVKNMLDHNPQHLRRYNHECHVVQPSYFKATIHNMKQRFNQSGGVHIVQTVTGCEWDDETGKSKGFNQYGYNGEDFISFDLETSTWITARPEAFSTKLKWDNDKGTQNFNRFNLIHLFPEWLKMYMKFGKSSLMRTVLPSVSLLQKSPSSPVTCHATGFYPDRAVMFWRKDGEELFEDVDHREILPNHDGSFQMSVDLLKPPPEDWGRYECVFQLSGVKEDQVYRLHKDVIRTNYKDHTNLLVAVGVVLLVLLLVAVVVGSVFYRQRKASKTRTAGLKALNQEDIPMNPPSCTQPDHEDQEEETLTTEPVKIY